MIEHPGSQGGIEVFGFERELLHVTDACADPASASELDHPTGDVDCLDDDAGRRDPLCRFAWAAADLEHSTRSNLENGLDRESRRIRAIRIAVGVTSAEWSPLVGILLRDDG